MQIYVKTYKANLAFLKNNLFMFYHTAQCSYGIQYNDKGNKIISHS